jgi:hypothetical protein
MRIAVFLVGGAVMSKAKLLCVLSCVIVFAGTASQALAEDPEFFGGIGIGEPIYSGTGCPQGTARVALSPQQRWLLVGFGDYAARTEPRRSFARASCNLAIPVTVPPGMRVSLSRLRVYGQAVVPPGGSGIFAAEYFFAGTVGPRVSRRVSGAFQGDFVIAEDEIIRSGCGESTIVRFNSSVTTARPSEAAGLAAMGVQFLALQVDMERC